MFGKCSLLLLKKLKEIFNVWNILGWPAILVYRMTRPMGQPGPPFEQFKPLTLTTSLWLRLAHHLSEFCSPLGGSWKIWRIRSYPSVRNCATPSRPLKLCFHWLDLNYLWCYFMERNPHIPWLAFIQVVPTGLTVSSFRTAGTFPKNCSNLCFFFSCVCRYIATLNLSHLSFPFQPFSWFWMAKGVIRS